jgi:primosomal protein N' (replication factor Y)
LFAEVLPNFPNLSATYHYSVPPELQELLRVGQLVEVGWGNQRVQGIVLVKDSEPPSDIPEFKPILALLDEAAVLTRAQLDLGYWLAHTYHAPLIDCLTLMLPPGLSKQSDSEYTLLDASIIGRNETEQRVIDLLKMRGALRARQIEHALPKRAWKVAVQNLQKQGVLNRKAVLAPPSVQAKQVRTVMLSIDLDDVPSAKLQLGRSSKHAEILQYLIRLWPTLPELTDVLHFTQSTRAQVRSLVQRNWLAILTDSTSPKSELLQLCLSVAEAQTQVQQLTKPSRKEQILDFLVREDGGPLEASWVYAETGATLHDLNRLAELGMVTFDTFEFWRDSVEELEYVADQPLPLTPGQTQVWEQTALALRQAQQSQQHALGQAPRPLLLHGVTGAGKTEIYLRAVQETLSAGRQSIVLVPEIALTPQTVRRFLARFPGRVAIWHSELSEGERYDTWRRCRLGRVQVLVGARSALFAPLPNIGLIVLDEEHADSYRQEPALHNPNQNQPFYHARATAVEYARRLDAVCILGSATPDVVSFAKAQRGDYQLLSLPRRVLAHQTRVQMQAERLHLNSRFQHDPQDPDSALHLDLPAVKLVDMRQELRAGNTSLLSRALQSALSETLARKEQAILFLNRRGQATYVFCRDCGHTLNCPDCLIPYTYHRANRKLMCHHCGKSRNTPNQCPQCASPRIKFFGVGTERVEAVAQELFPQARFLRWDQDATRVRGAHERILQAFNQQQADVLVGTQMIAKGLDLPLVTLVGVISADVGLSLPDYRTNERAFQVLAQVAGRAGRSLLGGQVVLQTYQPDHYVIQTASQHDYVGFFEKELDYRKQQGYPPFGRLVRLLGQSTDITALEAQAKQLGGTIRLAVVQKKANSTQVSGPTPCFFEQLAGIHRWQIVLRGPNPARLLPTALPAGWLVEIDPINLL